MKKLSVVLMFLAISAIYGQDDIVQNSIKGMLTYNQGQVVSLAEAFTPEQYNWRPAEGVRSTGESLLHIAGANYYLASKMGFPPPEDVDMMNIEKIQGKENILAALKKSNEFVLDKIGKVESGKFGEEVDFGFGKFNRLSGLLIFLEHNGEHKGQLIAYARSNGVTPPWSN
ncbi:DinB family protein [Pareuzebyella sediminis]|uniref:DinB family protein n=1 Tax=Pareuzebyella sediminis TaxID=2607998 RepID=UPI0011EE5F05|nr:DinB family protein [Pareuzebyella sediminis]